MSDLRAALRASIASIDGLDAWPWPFPSAPVVDAAAAHAWGQGARAGGVTTLLLEGGEPLREPGWRRLVADLARAGLMVELATTGRLLGYPKVALAVARAGLAGLHVPVLATTPALHDALVRVPGAHAQVLAGLATLRQLGGGPPVCLRAWLDPRTLDEVPGLVALAARLGAARLDLRLGADTAHRVAPEAARAVLARALDAAAGAGLPLTLSDVPPCWAGVGGLAACLASPLPTWYGVAPGTFADAPVAPAHAPACAWCAYAEACAGLPPGAAATDAMPLPGPIPNCFELVAVSERSVAGLGCARDAWPEPPDPHRDLLYTKGTRAWLLRAQSGYFPRRRLAETRARGLLYVNVSERAHLDDFRAQLRRLERADGCDGCTRPCPGAFREAEGPVLAREEARVVAVLEGLAGDVLDVGFGPNYHGALFAGLHDAGTIRYAGLEPDPTAFATLARVRPDLAWQNAPLERLDPGDRRFDAAVLLRSWNHLVSLPEALGSLRRALRPGGRLVVVDNVRFGYHLPAGLAPEQGGAYEHHRNHDLPDAEAVLIASGFRVCERAPIVAGGDNQWMLVAEWRAS